MKKVIISVFLLACMTSVFAKSHLNFTAPCKISILHNDETYNSVQGSEIYQKSRGNSELQATTGLTALVEPPSPGSGVPKSITVLKLVSIFY